jgi:co-chaperonin GroES (HSP10)
VRSGRVKPKITKLVFVSLLTTQQEERKSKEGLALNPNKVSALSSQTVISVSQHNKNPTQYAGLVQIGHHHNHRINI